MASTRRLGVFCSVVLDCMLLFYGLPAVAAEPNEGDRVQAQRLFDEAMDLMQRGQYQLACQKFEQGQRLAPAIGNQFNLAECYEQTARMASAWIHYTQVADAAHARGETEREEVARERAKNVEPRVSFVTIKVANASPGTTMHCDDRAIAQSAWGTPMPLDVGKHVCRVSAPGKVEWSKTIDVAGEGTRTVFEVPALAEVPTRTEVSTRANTPEPGIAVTASAAQTSQTTAWPHGDQRLWALVSAGVGVVGLGVGTAMVVAAQSKHSKAEPYCDAQERCTEQVGVDALHDAKALSDWANLPFGVGLAGLGAGAILWFTAHPSRGEQLAITVNVSANGVLVRGRF